MHLTRGKLQACHICTIPLSYCINSLVQNDFPTRNPAFESRLCSAPSGDINPLKYARREDLVFSSVMMLLLVFLLVLTLAIAILLASLVKTRISL